MSTIDLLTNDAHKRAQDIHVIHDEPACVMIGLLTDLKRLQYAIAVPLALVVALEDVPRRTPGR